ncbi:MAG: hypothetical protein EXS16_19950 [Gemmataceae bacterium]|nr:hypothetical protein [Gemmataceae bacterium]
MEHLATTLARYARLWLSLAKFSLLGELAFRTNFLVKVFVELLWLAILLVFNFTIFRQTTTVADWSEFDYLFFIGCYFAMGGLIETLFLENCNEFADLVRSGDLDFFLLKPIDEQFLISCRKIDWACAPNVVLGFIVMAGALWLGERPVTLPAVALFLLMFACGAALAYGMLVALMSASIWTMRNQSLFEMWWLFTTLMRHPRSIFEGRLASPAGLFFSFVVPIMLVTNAPAEVMVRGIDWRIVCFTLSASVIAVTVSRWIFRSAMKRYRSASS